MDYLQRKKHINLTLEERLTKSKKKFNLTSKEIENANDSKTEIKRIENLGFLIYNKLRELGHEKYQAISQLKSSSIALLMLNYDTFIEAENRIAQTLSRYFGKEAKILSKEQGIIINAPSIFRKQIYEISEQENLDINALISIDSWQGKISFSNHDLVKGIKIPSKINIENGITIATLYHGHAINHKQHKFQIKKHQKIEKFYENFLFNAIKKNFNGREKPYSFFNKEQFSIASKALYSFISNATNKTFQFLDYNNSRISQKLSETIDFVAAINRNSNLESRKGRKPILKISKKNDEVYLLRLKSISENLGYRPSLHQSRGELIFFKNDYEKMRESPLLNNFNYQHQGIIINPTLL